MTCGLLVIISRITGCSYMCSRGPTRYHYFLVLTCTSADMSYVATVISTHNRDPENLGHATCPPSGR